MAGWVAGAIVGSAVIGGAAANRASKAQLQASREASAAQSAATEKSIEAQAAALEKSIASQERMFERQVGLQEPFRRVGVNALPELVEASRYTPFGMEQFQADPGYGFRLKEGLRALENSAAARGGLLSGNAMRGITRYGQGLASEEFGNAFNRYQAERQARLGPLQSLAGMSQSSANTLTGAAGNLGAGMAGAYGQLGAGTASAYGSLGSALGANAINAGNARASGYMGTANVISNSLGQGLNYYQNKQLMDLYGGGGTAVGGGGGGGTFYGLKR
jgi:hypothetical protein